MLPRRRPGETQSRFSSLTRPLLCCQRFDAGSKYRARNRGGGGLKTTATASLWFEIVSLGILCRLHFRHPSSASSEHSRALTKLKRALALASWRLILTALSRLILDIAMHATGPPLNHLRRAVFPTWLKLAARQDAAVRYCVLVGERLATGSRNR